jgi:hypothetical protein
LELDLRQKREREREKGGVVIEDPPPVARGWLDLSSIGCWVDHDHPQWPDLSLSLSLSLFSSFFLSEKVIEGGQWVAASGLDPLFGCLIGCFILILCFCIFVKILMCYLVIGGKKTHSFYNYRIAAPFYV